METWRQVDIAGKPADLLEFGPESPRFGVIYLHTYKGESLQGNEDFVRLFRELNIGCVCPRGGRCWWADRACAEFDPVLTPERYVVENVLPFINQRWNLGPRAVGIVGIDMGGQGALRLAFKYPQEFTTVAAIAPSIEYHELYWSGTPIDDMYTSKEQCRQDTAPMHIHPTNFPPHIFFACDPTDPWHRGAERLHEKMNALGVIHQCDLATTAGGHAWPYFNQMASAALQFIAAGLERESRRLI
jgi:S-formylglutathione hydrolase